MAETCFPGGSASVLQHANLQQQLAPMGTGLAGAIPAARAKSDVQQKPQQHGSPKAAWAAGPGAGGQVGQKPSMVSTSGVRYQQMLDFEGAAAGGPQPVNTRVNKAIKGMAGPYQKEAAVRSAAGAIRPWSPYAGLGERRGAKFANMFANAPASLKYGADPDAPSLFVPPATGYAAAVGAAAGKVARPGSGQMGTPVAWSPVPGHPARELWPKELQEPPKYCAGCRGAHQPENEQNPSWEPYTPRMRLQNLNQLSSTFQAALVKGQLCVSLNDSRIEPVRWTWRVKDADNDEVEVQPRNMAKQDFVKQLALMFDGLREGHEPYRHLATQAVQAFLDTRSPHLAAAVPQLITPLRLALQTYEPSLVGHALLMLQRLLKSHAKVGPQLLEHLRQLLPVMALFKKKRFVMHLPPPFCVGAAGSFTGSGCAPEQGGRTCGVCGCPLDKAYSAAVRRAQAHAAQLDNPHLLGQDLPATYARHPLQGRKSRKFVLADVILDTLDLIVATAGFAAVKQIVAYIPTYSYYDPH